MNDELSPVPGSERPRRQGRVEFLSVTGEEHHRECSRTIFPNDEDNIQQAFLDIVIERCIVTLTVRVGKKLGRGREAQEIAQERYCITIPDPQELTNFHVRMYEENFSFEIFEKPHKPRNQTKIWFLVMENSPKFADDTSYMWRKLKAGLQVGSVPSIVSQT